VEGLVDGIWFNQGQVCCAGSRLLMQESIADKLIGKIQDRMNTLRIGPPLDKAIDIGAIVARVQLERIQRLVDQASRKERPAGNPPFPYHREGYISRDVAEQRFIRLPWWRSRRFSARCLPR